MRMQKTTLSAISSNMMDYCDHSTNQNIETKPLMVHSWQYASQHIFKLALFVFLLSSVVSSYAGFVYPVWISLEDGGQTRPRMTQGFGAGWDTNRGHLGEDYAEGGPHPGSCGRNVRATFEGTITLSAYLSGWGNIVMIRHNHSSLPNGGVLYSLYGHLQSRAVSQGDSVQTGQIIGTVGTTGFSNACHLHFEIKTSSQPGPGYSGADFTGNSIVHNGVTYYRPSWFIENFGTGECSGTDNAAFVSESAPFDGDTVVGGQSFTKSWTMRNTGTATWRASCNHKWAWNSGEQFGAPEFIDVPHDVAPNETVTFTLNMTAPTTPGLYTGYWEMDRYGTGRFGQQVWVQVNVLPPTGSIRVNINPSAARDAGARWRRTGTSTWRTSGSSEHDLAPGTYTVEFNNVSGWTKPNNASVTVTSGNTTTITRNYEQQTGSIRVNINPSAVRDAGARWRRTGTSTWRTSGSTESGLPIGNYTVEFNTISGWNKPNNASVSVSNGQTTTITREYEQQTGSLRINLDPPDARSAGAQWRRVGTATWRDHGATENNIPIGSYSVEFQSLSAPWISPATLPISITHQSTSTHAVRYNRPPVLHVETSLFVHVGAEGHWPVTATDPDGDAVTLSALNGPDGSTLQNGTFNFTPSAENAGAQYVFTVRATDALGAVAEQEVALQVGAPPVIEPLSNQLAVVGETLSWQVSAWDPDNDEKTFAMHGAPVGAWMEGTGDARTIHYTAIMEDAGRTYPIVFTVSDPDGATEAQMSLQVKSPPIVVPIDRRRVLPGMSLTIPVYAWDLDGDEFTLTLADGPDGAELVPAHHGAVFEFTPDLETSAQVFHVHLQATDEDGVTDRWFEVEVVETEAALTPFVGQAATLTSAGGHGSATGQGQPVGVTAALDRPWTERLFSAAGIWGTTPAGGLPVPWLETQISGEGQIDPQGGWYVLDGTETTFVLAAAPFYYLDGIHWDGTPQPLAETFTTNRFTHTHQLHAIFRAERTPQGVPLAWLVALGLAEEGDDFDAIAASDPTGKGHPVWQDWVAGTDPLDPESRFRVTHQAASNGLVELRLHTVPRHRYVLWSTTNLQSGAWSRLLYRAQMDGGLTDAVLVADEDHVPTWVPVPESNGVLYVRPQVLRPEEAE